MTAEDLAPEEIEWLNHTVAEMRDRGEWGENGLGRLWLERAGMTMPTASQTKGSACFMKIVPQSVVEIFGIRAFGPVELVEIDTDSAPPIMIVVDHALEVYAKEPMAPLDLGGVVGPTRGITMHFRVSDEAREVDVFLIGVAAPAQE